MERQASRHVAPLGRFPPITRSLIRAINCPYLNAQIRFRTLLPDLILPAAMILPDLLRTASAV